jgi:hypothetical protein
MFNPFRVVDPLAFVTVGFHPRLLIFSHIRGLKKLKIDSKNANGAF